MRPDRPYAVSDDLGFRHPAVLCQISSMMGNFYTAGGPSHHLDLNTFSAEGLCVRHKMRPMVFATK